jgi:hypothetical protein
LSIKARAGEMALGFKPNLLISIDDLFLALAYCCFFWRFAGFQRVCPLQSP